MRNSHLLATRLLRGSLALRYAQFQENCLCRHIVYSGEKVGTIFSKTRPLKSRRAFAPETRMKPTACSSLKMRPLSCPVSISRSLSTHRMPPMSWPPFAVFPHPVFRDEFIDPLPLFFGQIHPLQLSIIFRVYRTKIIYEMGSSYLSGPCGLLGCKIKKTFATGIAKVCI